MLSEQNFFSITLEDQQTLGSFKSVVDGIAANFGENCEVLLHSFESLDRSIIHIANGHITGRRVGSPITDLGMKIIRESADTDRDVSGCYYSKTTDGKTLRSVSILIRNTDSKPIGMLCINFNMSAPFIDIIHTFQAREEGAENSENFVQNIDDLVKITLKDTINTVNGLKNIPNHEKNKTIVYELIKRGIFDIRGAIDIVARELSLSRYTIYNYVRENKLSQKKENT
jgi:predicted transcriptional regulator YheO